MNRQGKNLIARTSKQRTSDGVPAGSPMLKLVKEIGNVLTINSVNVNFHIHFSKRYIPCL